MRDRIAQQYTLGKDGPGRNRKALHPFQPLERIAFALGEVATQPSHRQEEQPMRAVEFAGDTTPVDFDRRWRLALAQCAEQRRPAGNAPF